MGKDLLDAGFGFNKSLFEFNKKVNKSKVGVWIDFYDYKPSWLDFKCDFKFELWELAVEAKLFYKYCGFEFNWNEILMFEGDFHPITKYKEAKYRIDYCHRIYNIQKDMPEIEYARKLLREEFLPRIPIYTDLSLFQDYVLNNYKTLLSNHAPYHKVLIAAKLKGLSELEELVPYYWEKLELAKKPDTDFGKQFVSKIIPYAKGDSVSN